MQMFLCTITDRFGMQKAGAYLLDHSQEEAEKNFLNPKDEGKKKKRQLLLANIENRLNVIHISKTLWNKEHVFKKNPEKYKS